MEAVANSPAAWSARAAAACPLEAVGWTESGQADRFAAVLAHLDLQAGDRVLDYGCGLGAFADWLPDNIGYVGFDWSDGMVARAAAERPARAFTSGFPALKFSHVVAVGCFNLPDGWSKQQTFHLLRHLWDTTGCRTLAASLYAGEDDRCLQYTEQELERLGRDLGYGATVTRHRHNDLLLVARR